MQKVIDIRPEDRFRLDEAFLVAYQAKKPDFGSLGEITYRRTYSRQKPNGTYERWWETVARVVNGCYTYQKWHCHRLGLPWRDDKAQRSAQEMYGLIFDMKFLPPGRGLWMAGTEYVEKQGSMALNNCAMVSTEYIDQDFADPFCFLMDVSMLGVGAGFDTRGAGKIVVQRPAVGGLHMVDDSREGWVFLVRAVLNAYTGVGSLPGAIDYSRLRPEGAPIKGFGGTASGAAPLIRLVEGIQKTLDPLIGKPITSTAIVDIADRIGVCVVSGNVRRSALLALGDEADNDFIRVKDPKLHEEALLSHRWASNNTIIARRGMDYSEPAKYTAINGEPGYFFLDNARRFGRFADAPDDADARVCGLNPCAEQCLEHREVCCLVETFPSRHSTFNEYRRTLKFAYLYAKTITLVPTHDARTNAVVMRNRRIGTSQSGIVESFVKHGRRVHLQWCDDGYKYLRKLDQVYADWLCIPRSKRITTVKPAGTTSILPGVTPGVHYPHSEYYHRTIRIAKGSRLLAPLESAGYRIEQDVYDQSSMVVYFPIHEKHFERSKNDVSMWEQLSNAAAMQRYWSDNAVSITVTFKPDEASQIAHALQVYEDQLKSVSFLPLSDHGYAQAPYQAITKAEYEAAASKLKPIDFDAAEHEADDKFCDGDRCAVA